MDLPLETLVRNLELPVVYADHKGCRRLEEEDEEWYENDLHDEAPNL